MILALDLNLRYLHYISTNLRAAWRITAELNELVRYYRYPLLRLDPTFGSRCNSPPISLIFCEHTLVISVFMFCVFFPAENDAEER